MPRTPDSANRLLPTNSSPLEIALAKAMPFDAPLHAFAPLITSAKLADMPDSWLPWLVIEYGLSDLSEFFPDQRELIVEGLKLRTLRGTPAGAELALSWIGYPDAKVYEDPTPGLHFSEWEIDLGRVPRDLTDLCKIAKLARIVQPVRSRLRRVFHGYDVRKFVLDESDWGNLLSHYSGVWVDDLSPCAKPTGLWASFSSSERQWINHEENIEVRFYYERRNDYGVWVHPPLYPVLDDDYEDSFYPWVGVASWGRHSELDGGRVFRYPSWGSLARESQSVRDLDVVRVRHVSETVAPGVSDFAMDVEGGDLVPNEDASAEIAGAWRSEDDDFVPNEDTDPTGDPMFAVDGDEDYATIE